MKLYKIDKMKSCKMKLFLWIKFGKKYDCLDQMPEIYELYHTLRKREEITPSEFMRMMDTNYMEVVAQ